MTFSRSLAEALENGFLRPVVLQYKLQTLDTDKKTSAYGTSMNYVVNTSYPNPNPTRSRNDIIIVDETTTISSDIRLRVLVRVVARLRVLIRVLVRVRA
eukprot:scaffold62473_cov17-Prasinocladus_malaysianus.AAC.1